MRRRPAGGTTSTGRSNASTREAAAAESLDAASDDDIARAMAEMPAVRVSMMAAKAWERSVKTSVMYLGERGCEAFRQGGGEGVMSKAIRGARDACEKILECLFSGGVDGALVHISSCCHRVGEQQLALGALLLRLRPLVCLLLQLRQQRVECDRAV
jgi:hypothetical protein